MPAAFNNIVGLKPTKGLIPTQGVVPACRSLDCVSIFALTAADAAAVLDVAGGFDAADPFSRAEPQRPVRGFAGLADRRACEPEQREFFGDDAAEAIYDAALERAARLSAPGWSRSTSHPFLDDGGAALRRPLGRRAHRGGRRVPRGAPGLRSGRPPAR